MAHEIGVRRDELLERRVDGVEMDVGDEAVDGGVDAGRLRPVQIAVAGMRFASTRKSASPRA